MTKRKRAVSGDHLSQQEKRRCQKKPTPPSGMGASDCKGVRSLEKGKKRLEKGLSPNGKGREVCISIDRGKIAEKGNESKYSCVSAML